MNELPDVPFEQILRYLTLADRLKARRVSRRWRDSIDTLKVQCLFYSQSLKESIVGKSRLISRPLDHNFINSLRRTSFFATFGPMILSNLRHLRFCQIDVNAKQITAFTQMIQSFVQLEQLDLCRLNIDAT